jgi:hypothetical protein
VGGSFDSFNGVPRQCIVRLNSDGAVDGALDVGAGVPSGDYIQAVVRNLVPLADRRFIAGGAFRSFGGVERPWVARFEATGAVDREFYADLPVSCREAASLALQPDGKLLVLAVRGDGIFLSFSGCCRRGREIQSLSLWWRSVTSLFLVYSEVHRTWVPCPPSDVLDFSALKPPNI